MESRELFKAAGHLSTTLNWDQEWIHFGTGDKIKTELIEDLIDNFLVGNHVNLVFGRTNSGTFDKAEILSRITDLLGAQNFQLWNESLDKAIQFEIVGVLLKGTK